MHYPETAIEITVFLLLLLTPNLIGDRQKPELVTYKGVLKVGKYESTINYTGEQTGDWMPFCFNNRSAVGRAIFSECTDGKRCKFTGYVRWDDCRLGKGASATARIVSVKSVSKVIR